MRKGFILDESDINKILSTPVTEIPETNTLHDITLNKEERIQNAKTILMSRNNSEIQSLIKKNMKSQGITFQDLKKLAEEKRK